MQQIVVPDIKPVQPASKLGYNTPEPLTEAQFKKIAAFIQENVGIQMPDSKKMMMQARLTTRLKALKLSSFAEYIDYAFSSNSQNADSEMIHLIDVLTTNQTFFFRENQHFDYLSDTVLPEFAERGITRPEIWSAGCSTGEEPYTLSIVINEFMRTHPGSFSGYHILATDISTRVLSQAQNAVYPMESVESMTYDLKKRYFLKSRNQENPQVRIKPELRGNVSFQRLNFMDSVYNGIPNKQIIFCRNVLIYFERSQQIAVVSKLVDHLDPGGYLFLGHSETIFGADLPLQNVAPTVFRKLPVNGV